MQGATIAWLQVSVNLAKLVDEVETLGNMLNNDPKS